MRGRRGRDRHDDVTGHFIHGKRFRPQGPMRTRNHVAGGSVDSVKMTDLQGGDGKVIFRP